MAFLIDKQNPSNMLDNTEKKGFFNNPLLIILVFSFLCLILMSTVFINAFNVDADVNIKAMSDLMYQVSIWLMILLVALVMIAYLAKVAYNAVLKNRNPKRDVVVARNEEY